MNLEQIADELAKVRIVLDCHTDLLAILNAQSVTHTARLETILSVLREILSKHGVSKETSQKICADIFATQLGVAQSESAKMRDSADKHRLPPSSSAEAGNN